MCGRYYIETEEDGLQAILNAAGKSTKSGEIFPHDHAPVITSSGEVKSMLWGFSSFDGKNLIINARSETAHEKPMFKRAFYFGRCLVPSSYYFEWEKLGPKEKRKCEIYVKDSKIIYFAGLSRTERDGEVSYVILTEPAQASIRHIHERMPVILPPTLHDEWLHGDGVSAIRKKVNVLEFV